MPATNTTLSPTLRSSSSPPGQHRGSCLYRNYNKEDSPGFSQETSGFSKKLFSDWMMKGEMALAGSCPLLLLFLGLWEVPASAKPQNLTYAQWFQVQHVQPSPLQCNRAMGRINYYTQRCKPLNTFLHDTFPNVALACGSPSVTCKNGQGNCHQSPGTVPITQCDLTSGKYPNCRYRGASLDRAFVVACDPPEDGDPPEYQLVPVHLDGTISP